MKIPLSAPDVTESEISRVAEVLRSPRLSLGPRLEEFEERFARYTNSKHAVAINSGTAGLHLAVRALDLKNADEVITTPFSFVASANVLLYEKALPVFADIDPQTLNIDPQKIELAITEKTKAILVVHVFGRPSPMAEIVEIARRHNLKIIEDAAEAIGAEIFNRKVGAIGAAGVFAFYPNKQITTGEGGMLITDDATLAHRARILRNQGRDSDYAWFEHAELGYNYRLSEINCELGNAQLERIEQILEQRETAARRYDARLRGNPNLILPEIHFPAGRISWFVYVVRLADEFTQRQRDWIVDEMQRCEIGCGRYFAPIHLQPVYRKAFHYKNGDFPIAEHVSERVIALPFFNRISAEQIEHVCDVFERTIETAKMLHFRT